MKPSQPPITPEQAEKGRQVLNEYDDIVTHDRVLAREQHVGQFAIGAVKYGAGTGGGVLIAQRAHEIIAQGPGIDNKLGILITAAGAIAGGIKRIVGRNADARRVDQYEEERVVQTGGSGAH